MGKKQRVILHYKWSLADGHVTPQILQIKGYKGIILTKEAKDASKKSPFGKQVYSLEELKRNKKFFKENRVLAVHVHHGSLSAKLMFLKKRYKLPLIVGFRGSDATAFPKKQKNREALVELFKLGDLFLPVCRHLKNKIIELGCPKEKIRVLYGGVDLKRFKFCPRLKPEKGPVKFLGIGRFVPKKGFEYLIDAFAKLRRITPDIQLTLIGEGECELEYRKRIADNGLNNHVTLVSWVDYQKVQKVYYKHHIFCAPSCTDTEGNQEGIPNTLKEAMATGMPVIATNHAGIPELVKHGEAGLLVQEKNVEQLVQAMSGLIHQHGKWEEMGKQARKKIEKDFNLKRQLKKQKKYYDEMLKRIGR